MRADPPIWKARDIDLGRRVAIMSGRSPTPIERAQQRRTPPANSWNGGKANDLFAYTLSPSVTGTCASHHCAGRPVEMQVI